MMFTLNRTRHTLNRSVRLGDLMLLGGVNWGSEIYHLISNLPCLGVPSLVTLEPQIGERGTLNKPSVWHYDSGLM